MLSKQVSELMLNSEDIPRGLPLIPLAVTLSHVGVAPSLHIYRELRVTIQKA